MNEQPVTPNDLAEKARMGRMVYLSELSEETLDKAGLLRTVLPVFADYKQRIRSLAEILVQATFKGPAKNEALRIEISQILQALSYLLNSSSYEDDAYHAFDKKEIDRKLRRTDGLRASKEQV